MRRKLAIIEEVGVVGEENEVLTLSISEDVLIGLPADEQLFDELMSLRWRPAATGGQIQVEDKRDWSARVGRSPDKADCISMAVAQTAGEELVHAFQTLTTFSRERACW